MKKVLFLVHTLQVGGAEKVLVNLVNHMNKEKYDITVMTVINTGAFRKDLAPHIHYKTIFNIPFLSNKGNTSKNSGNLLDKPNAIKKMLANIYQFVWRHSNCKKIYQRYIKEEYDVEIAFLEGIAAKIIASSKSETSKKLSWIHIDLLKERKTEKFFKNPQDEKQCYEKFDQIICVSKNVKEQFIKKFQPIDETKIIVKYNPIDEELIKSKAEEKIEEIEKKRKTICTVGRLSKQKGYDRLLRIIKKLNEEGLEFDAWIIGVGEEEENLKKYVRDNRLQNVKLLGYQPNPYKYMKKADLFVCSSITEGFSTVVSEALILGKRIVTTDCSGMREILGENGEYGILVENSEEALYKALKENLITEDLTRQEEPIAKSKERFNLEQLTREIEQLIGV